MLKTSVLSLSYSYQSFHLLLCVIGYYEVSILFKNILITTTYHGRCFVPAVPAVNLIHCPVNTVVLTFEYLFCNLTRYFRRRRVVLGVNPVLQTCQMSAVS